MLSRVLVVEDEESYSDALAYLRRKEGFEVAIAAEPSVGNRIVGIGASTGGVQALQEILTRLPQNAPPILIVQRCLESIAI